jgi:Ca-activated chloride channel homolog
MIIRTSQVPLVLAMLFVAGTLAAQGRLGEVAAPLNGTPPFDVSKVNMTMLSWQAERGLSPLDAPSLNVSKLDLKAPDKARREYDKGFQLLSRKDYPGAVPHLVAAISIYPDFVAAHNALGSSYLGLGEKERARDEFAKAVSLDDHLPISHANLGCAEMAMQHYPAAEEAVQKASLIAPLDLQVLAALTYAQLMNHEYAAAIATANRVHARKHKGVAIVHLYAAAAWDGQSNLEEARNELQTFLQEDPKSPAADAARELLKQVEQDQLKPKVQPSTEQQSAAVVATASSTASEAASSHAVSASNAQVLLQEAKERQQITEAEAMCSGCEPAASQGAAKDPVTGNPNQRAESAVHRDGGWTLRSAVDEVAVLFAATDHGKSVPDLTPADVVIRDDRRAPATITGFLNERQLPLRLGIVIDTSGSVSDRFSFEQAAASDFLQKVMIDPKDLAFVVGFSNSILLVQDFTADQNQISHAIGQLAPAGGTSLWDAVGFAADKLASRPEETPVARMLVVISDGADNSSSATLKEAIESAGRDEVIVYAVSTRDQRDAATAFDESFVGDHALKVLSESTGGTAFFPGSIRWLDHGLLELQQVIRGRYLVSYKPEELQQDGRYRSIDIGANKSGHKLRIYARKGYYARSSLNN